MLSVRIPKALWGLLALALTLRLVGAWSAHLIFDERAHWALAETIDFRPGHLHLVSRTLDHPLLSVYVLRLGSLLLGTSDFALRLPYVLAGALTLVPVYFLGKRAFSERAGLWAAALLAVDQFHAGWSRVFMPEVLLLLLGSLVLLQFLRALERDTAASFALLGGLLGLAYLAKEPAIFLLPGLWIYLAVTPAHRHLLLRPRWYLAQAVFLLVIAPDLIWNLSQWTESYLYRDAALAASGWQLSLKPVSLYLGECLRAVLGPVVLDTDYEQGNLYVCFWLVGLLYLAAVAAAGRMKDVPAVRLLLITFVVVVAIVFALPGGGVYDPFWWASLSLIPAVVCAGGVMDGLMTGVELIGAGRPSRRRNLEGANRSVANRVAIVSMLLVMGLAARELTIMRRPGREEPRATARQFATDFTQKGIAALDRGDLGEAQGRFIYALNIGGPDADAYRGLARVAYQRGQTARARSLLEKCLQLAPQHPEAIQLHDEISLPNP